MKRVALACAAVAAAIICGAAGPSGLQAAFRNTVVSTYPDGRQAQLWLAKDGSTGRIPVENVLRWVPTKSRWGNWLLFPVVPDQAAPDVVELDFKPSPCFKRVEVWTIE